VNHPHPRREFGLVPPEVAGRTSRFEFLQGLLDASHPMPPFSEVAEVWPISAEVERVVFEASLSARFYHPMGLIGAAPWERPLWLWACHVAHGSRSTTRSTLGMMDAPLAREFEAIFERDRKDCIEPRAQVLAEARALASPEGQHALPVQ
jgi:hypothetical protein